MARSHLTGRRSLSPPFPSFFLPFEHKTLRLPNRIVMAPMTRYRSPGGVPDEQVAAYYRARAEGGAGFIITEGTIIGRPGASDHADIPNFYDAASLAGWRHVVEEVHAAGGRIAPQLWHMGMLRKPGTGPFPDAASEGPSGRTKTGKQVREPMSDEEIADTIATFVQSARAAKDIGFDAVELHGAHGYLIDQFLWGHTNTRDDAFGGDTIRRTHFAQEVVRGIRAAVGPDFPILLRLSQWKLQDYSAKLGSTPDEWADVVVPLAEAGVDIFDCSTRRYREPEFEGSPLNLAGWTRKLTGSPTITVGSIGLEGTDFIQALGGDEARSSGLDDVHERLTREEFDLVAVGRAMIANPDWVEKVRTGRLDELATFSRDMLETL